MRLSESQKSKIISLWEKRIFLKMFFFSFPLLLVISYFSIHFGDRNDSLNQFYLILGCTFPATILVYIIVYYLFQIGEIERCKTRLGIQ